MIKCGWWVIAPVLVGAVLGIEVLVFSGCEGNGNGGESAFPVFEDANGNAINDYVESGTHLVSQQDPRRHGFVDGNHDAVCDLAQQANPVWHGPGYIDTDGDGVCDYWDTDSSRHHAGRRDIVHGFDFSEVGRGGMSHP